MNFVLSLPLLIFYAFSCGLTAINQPNQTRSLSERTNYTDQQPGLLYISFKMAKTVHKNAVCVSYKFKVQDKNLEN